MCYEEARFHLRGITETSRRDRDFKQMVSQIKEVEEILASTERERKKQQEAIFGVMNMINVAGGLVPKQTDMATQTDASIPSKYGDIFTEAPLTDLWNESSSLVHKMVTLSYDQPTDESQTNKKTKKKDSSRPERELSQVGENVTNEDTLRFIAKVFSEKQKRDLVSQKNRTLTCSLDELTVLTVLEEYPTKLRDAISVLATHFKNLRKEFRVGKSPAAELTARLFGICGRKKVQSDLTDQVLTIFKDLATQPGAVGQLNQSKPISELILYTKRYFASVKSFFVLITYRTLLYSIELLAHFISSI